MPNASSTLDIYVLPETTADKIVVVDTSSYVGYPDSPHLSIYLPGFSNAVNVPFNSSAINIITSFDLGLSDVACSSDLPDGVYTIKYIIGRNENQKLITKYHLHDSTFRKNYYSSLSKIDYHNRRPNEKQKLEKQLLIIDINWETAKALTETGDISKASYYLQRAAYQVSKL